MNSEQLLQLIDISKTGSIRMTAKRLYTSQQAISESIKRLEKELNCTLLSRSKNGVTLTDDGKIVLNYALSTIENYNTLLQYFESKASKTHIRGTLAIGTAPIASNTILMNLILEIYNHYPDITCYLQEQFTESIIDSLVQKEIDFGIIGISADGFFNLTDFKQLINNTPIHFQQLCVDSLVCVMSQNNPLSVYQSLYKSQLNTTKYTLYHCNDINMIHLDRQNCLLISNNTALHQKFMQEKNTVCCLPKQTFKTLYNDKQFVAVPIIDAAPVIFYLLYLDTEEFSQNPIHHSFIHTTMQLFQNIEHN